MNKRLKAITLAVIMLLAVALLTSCKDGGSPFAKYDEDGYTVSVKYDANGGTFTTNTSVMTDSYNPDDFPSGELPLIAPDDAKRQTPMTAKRNGYFLVGWYTERNAVLDSEGNHLDENGEIASVSGGEPAYTYGGLWTFSSDRLRLEDGRSYTASEPALTLYAAWVREFSYEFYDLGSGELIEAVNINPLKAEALTLPYWDTESGAMTAGDFPTVSGKTFEGAYLSSDGTNKIDGSTVAHHGKFNYENATYENNVMKIFVDYRDGVWYKISTADQLIANAKASGCYEILDDLDFEGKTWPFTGIFRGTIQGNGHTLTGISARQSSASSNAGLFASIASTAIISDLNIENATYTVGKGASTNGACYGLLAGKVEEGATFTGVTLTGKLIIAHDARINSDKQTSIYNLGLVCGLGYDYTGIDYSGITVECTVNESTGATRTLTVSGNDVTVE